MDISILVFQLFLVLLHEAFLVLQLFGQRIDNDLLLIALLGTDPTIWRPINGVQRINTKGTRHHVGGSRFDQAGDALSFVLFFILLVVGILVLVVRILNDGLLPFFVNVIEVGECIHEFATSKFLFIV